MWVRHPEKSFKSLPKEVRTVFPRKTAAAKQSKKKKSCVLKRTTRITLQFPSKSLLEKCRELLIREKCPIDVNMSEKTLTYLVRDKALVTAALKILKKDFSIRIEDVG